MVFFVAVASAQTPAIRSELGVINAAGFGKTDKVAAGSLFSIYGTNLSGTLAQTDSTTLSTSMADVDSVTFTSGTTVVKAPLRFVFGTQINQLNFCDLGGSCSFGLHHFIELECHWIGAFGAKE